MACVPKVRKARWPKTRRMRKYIFDKYSLYVVRYACFTVELRCMTRIRLWPLRRDKHPGVLIGAGGKWYSGWLECV